MTLKDHWKEFLAAGRDNIHARIWDLIIAAAIAGVLHVGWRVGLTIAVFMGLFGAFAFRQIRVNRTQDLINAQVLQTHNILAGITLTAEDVLKEAAEADAVAAAAERAF